ncbi:hypothetical protein EVG20_g7764 [Dentipellis fragilis]|uniref:F-box domain-containing protein n=1 Tax=Dentipellis fragilis TaxID=205917 RepID=A0A4Y9YBJ2_9AGAM|nr:hypothetical protein EVG20_g7764 [Dentipellis fragilis]
MTCVRPPTAALAVSEDCPAYPRSCSVYPTSTSAKNAVNKNVQVLEQLGNMSLRQWCRATYALAGARWSIESLTRSGAPPLQISFDLKGGSGMKTAQIVTSHIHHIRELRVEGGTQQLQQVCDSLVYKAAPILESLSFSGIRPLPGQNTVVSIPDNIFACNAPRLRSLSLVRLLLQGSTVLAFTQLTIIETNFVLTVEATWRLLQNTPHIEVLICDGFAYHLSLRGRLDFPPEVFPSPKDRPINVPHLTNIVVDDADVEHVVWLLNALLAPSLSRIALFGFLMNSSSVDLYADAFPLALSPHINALRQTRGPIQELIIEEFSIACWRSCSDLYYYEGRDGIEDGRPFYFRWQMSSDVEVIDPLFRNLLRVLPVDEVHELTFGRSDRPWESLYRISNVTTLKYAYETSENVLFFLQAMIPLQQRIAIGEEIPLEERTLFPQLARITFKDFRTPADEDKFLRVIRRLAEARRQVGITLEIEFEAYNFPANIMAELGTIMNMTWNETPWMCFEGLREDPELDDQEGRRKLV